MTEPTEMIERMARAIADNIGPSFDNLHKNKRHWIETRGIFGDEHRDVNGPFRDDCMEAARAALSALQEPDARMVEAGGAIFGFGGDPESAERVFTAMIKAARGDQ
jgi:hypothetical protein